MQLVHENTEHNEYVFRCSGITKSFGGTHALKNVELSVKKGEVHALMGENGAGKSTLMKAIIGLHQVDEGTMYFLGKPYKVSSPAEAIKVGISMIHQELNPEPTLTIAENIFLHKESTKAGFLLDKKKTNRQAEEILEQFNFPMNTKTLMEELTLAQAQMIEIIKAVSCNAKLVIMDEPTSSLDSEETERLFKTILKLKESGVSIIYISHRMEEIYKICDKVTVYRDGQYVGTKEVASVTNTELISMMVGRKMDKVYPEKTCKIKQEVFRVENLSGKGFQNISFEVHAGEILGLTGLVGSGRSETMRAIFGLDQITEGKMYLEGKEITNKSPKQAIKKGIAMVNEDRRNYGLCLYRSICENISLPNLPFRQKALLLNKIRERRECSQVAQQLNTKTASIEAEAFSLSGGNQQKVVLAKWIMSNPKVLILDEPTRGVDVGAKSEIYSLMCEFAKEGMAIIMISSEMPEILGMSDNIIIYHEGKLNGKVSRNEIMQNKVTSEMILAKEFGE